MPLHAEQIADSLVTTLRTLLPEQLARGIRESDATIPLPAPTEWFLGTPTRITQYRCPAGFVQLLPVQTSGSVGLKWGALLKQEFRAQVSIVFEGARELGMTLAGYRYASAMDETLHNRDITERSDWATRLWVTRVLYAPTLVGRQVRTFRKAVALSATISHWDLFTPVP